MDKSMDDREFEDGYESRLDIKVYDDSAANLATVQLNGRLDIFTYRDLSKTISEQFNDREGVKLVVDLTGVDFVASSGWSVFVATRTRLKRIGGKIALSGLNDELLRVYKAMRMPDLVPCFKTTLEARAGLLDAQG